MTKLGCSPRKAYHRAMATYALCLLVMAQLVAARTASNDALPTARKQGAMRRGEAAAPRLFSDDRVAVVVYAPATFSRQLKCEALVESIRSQGLWGGRLYLITEQLKCYQHERWMQCGLDADIIALDDTQAEKTLRQQHHSAWWRLMFGPTWDVIKARLVRSQLWELLQPPPATKAIVYIHGCEILVGSSLEPFMNQALEQYAQQPQPLLVVAPPDMDAPKQYAQQAEGGGAGVAREISNPAAAAAAAEVVAATARGPLDGSGSVWVLHKEASAPLLQAWREEVMSGSKSSSCDEQLLVDAVKRAGGPTCKVSKEAGKACVERLVARTGGWSRKLWCDLEQGCGAALAPAVFNYVPTSVCASTDHEMVTDWVTTLDLCVYQDLGYCLPTLMQPFAQSWLPYPQCGKLELGISRLACQWSCTETSVIRSPGFRTSVTPRALTLPAGAPHKA